MITEKSCVMCKQVMPVSEFTKVKRSYDGFGYWCKQCKSEYNKKYTIINKENKAKYRKKYYDLNKEKIAKKLKEYRLRKKEELIEKHKEYRIKNKKKITEKKREEILKLTDSYISRGIRNKNSLPKESKIPEALIEAKRMQIKLHRLIKELR